MARRPLIPVDEVARAELDVLVLAERWQRSWTRALGETWEQANELSHAIRALRRLRCRAARNNA